MNYSALGAVCLALGLGGAPTNAVPTQVNGQANGQAGDFGSGAVMLASNDSWERFKNIRQGKSAAEEEAAAPPAPSPPAESQVETAPRGNKEPAPRRSSQKPGR